jgi:hypothetical protein
MPLIERTNGPHYQRRVGLDSSEKRKNQKPEPTRFGGVNPAVRVHAVLGCFLDWTGNPFESRFFYEDLLSLANQSCRQDLK